MMTRDYLIKRVNNRIDLNQEAINECTASDMRLVISNNNDLLRLIKARLEKSDKTYEEGINDCWEFMKTFTLLPSDGGMDPIKFEKIFGHNFASEMVKTHTYYEALAKVKAYEERPVVGDVVKHSNVYGHGSMTFIVINISNKEIKGLRSTGETCTFSYPNEYITKTGKHVDLEGLFDSIKED